MGRYLVMLYHRNPQRQYQERWIEGCLDSIRNQSFQDFDVFELDYGGTGNQIYDESRFLSMKTPTFVEATNFILDYARNANYRGAFNVHLDDLYSLKRFEKQVVALDEYDLVSSNFYAIDEEDEIVERYEFHELDITAELHRGHNVICNPVVAFSRRWLETAIRYDPTHLHVEDMGCWLANSQVMEMTILPEFLCYKRMHPNEASVSGQR